MKIIDLFAGAGGMSKGFELAGFEIGVGIEWNKAALGTFSINHKNAESLDLDLYESPPPELIRNLKDEVLGIIGGPPCQGFSNARGSRRKDDKRNNLVPNFIEWVGLLKPNFFVMENVVGLKTISGGRFFQQVLKNFTKMGYNTQWNILHAASYGVPQKRERLFIIGISKEHSESWDFGNFFPKETHRVPEAMRGL